MIDRDIFDLIMGDAESYLMELGYNLHLLRYFKTTNQMSKINVAASLEKINSGQESGSFTEITKIRIFTVLFLL